MLGEKFTTVNCLFRGETARKRENFSAKFHYVSPRKPSSKLGYWGKIKRYRFFLVKNDFRCEIETTETQNSDKLTVYFVKKKMLYDRGEK